MRGTPKKYQTGNQALDAIPYKSLDWASQDILSALATRWPNGNFTKMENRLVYHRDSQNPIFKCIFKSSETE